jgi:hypothetical protein
LLCQQRRYDDFYFKVGPMKTATQVLQEQLIKEAGRKIAEEVDFGVVCSLLVDIGWVKVEFDTLGSNKHAIDINNWLHTECKKHWKHHGRTFVFESKNEAALFKLTWS